MGSSRTTVYWPFALRSIPEAGKNSTACSGRYLCAIRRTLRSEIVTSESNCHSEPASHHEARWFSKKRLKRDVPDQGRDDQNGDHNWWNEPVRHGAPPPFEFFGDLRSIACLGCVGVQSRANLLASAICAGVKCATMRSYPERARC